MQPGILMIISIFLLSASLVNGASLEEQTD